MRRVWLNRAPAHGGFGISVGHGEEALPVLRRVGGEARAGGHGLSSQFVQLLEDLSCELRVGCYWRLRLEAVERRDRGFGDRASGAWRRAERTRPWLFHSPSFYNRSARRGFPLIRSGDWRIFTRLSTLSS